MQIQSNLIMTISTTQKIIISKDKSKKDVKITKHKPKSLSREEVLEIVDKLPMDSNGEVNPRIRLVKSKKE